MKYGYILFHTNTDGLIMEKYLKSKRIRMKVVPTPRAISTSCGFSIRFAPVYYDKIKKLIEEQDDVSILAIHLLDDEAKKFKLDGDEPCI